MRKLMNGFLCALVFLLLSVPSHAMTSTEKLCTRVQGAFKNFIERGELCDLEDYVDKTADYYLIKRCLNYVLHDEQPLLHWAIVNAPNIDEAFSFLVEHGADVFVEDMDGVTPLELALETGNNGIVDRIEEFAELFFDGLDENSSSLE